MQLPQDLYLITSLMRHKETLQRLFFYEMEGLKKYIFIHSKSQFACYYRMSVFDTIDFTYQNEYMK